MDLDFAQQRLRVTGPDTYAARVKANPSDRTICAAVIGLRQRQKRCSHSRDSERQVAALIL